MLTSSIGLQSPYRLINVSNGPLEGNMSICTSKSWTVHEIEQRLYPRPMRIKQISIWLLSPKSVLTHSTPNTKTSTYRRNSKLLIRPLPPRIIQQTLSLKHIFLLFLRLLIRRPRPHTPRQLKQTRRAMKNDFLFVFALAVFGSKC
jgi:hypothetical protein